MGGKFHLMLIISLKPIANKYHEGKMKRTLERELKVPEIAGTEADGTSCSLQDCLVNLLFTLYQCKLCSVKRFVDRGAACFVNRHMF